MLWPLLGILFRSALILLFAELLRRLPRNASPAYRHLVLRTGFLLLLLWPLFPLFVPDVSIPLAFGSPLSANVTVQQAIRTTTGTQHLPWLLLLISSIWIGGVLCALLPLIAGYVRVLRLSRSGLALADPSSCSLARELIGQSGLRETPVILVVPEHVVPQTFGLFRPVVLLPEACLSWSESKLRAVLLHESAHVARHDLMWQLLVNVTTAFCWFQPLAWIARHWVREESELACDAAVLASGMQPSTYAAELLAIAQAFRVRGYESAAALPMAGSGSLEHRLRSVLAARPARHERSTRGAIVILFLLTAVCSGVSVTRNGQLLSQGGVSMKRTLFSTLFPGLLTSAGLSAATVGGSILDPSGAAVLNAKASLYNPDTKARQETVSMADGKFGFNHLDAGQYILRVEKPGFAPILREFNVQQDSTVDRGLTLHSGTNADSRDNGPVDMGAPGSRPIRVGGQVAQSNLVEKVQPVYPAAAKSAGVQGSVELQAVISAEGVPQDIQVVSSPSDDLSQSALEAVRQWRYRPTLLNGNPVTILTEILVNYTLAP